MKKIREIKECPRCKGDVALSLNEFCVQVSCRGTCVEERLILECYKEYYDPEIVERMEKILREGYDNGESIK